MPPADRLRHIMSTRAFQGEPFPIIDVLARLRYGSMRMLMPLQLFNEQRHCLRLAGQDTRSRSNGGRRQLRSMQRWGISSQ